MTLPGVTVTTEDGRTPAGPRTALGTIYPIGELERGPLTPQRCRNMRDVVRIFGARTVDTLSMHDFLEGHFSEGGSIAWVLRLVGPAAAHASLDLSDGTTVALEVEALDIGDFGDRIAVDIDVSGSNFTVKVYLDGELKETSPSCADGPAAAAWSQSSKLIRITDGPGGDPVATATPQPLTGGDDDLDGITTEQIAAAAAIVPEDLGTGSYVLPGRTATASHLALGPIADERNRLVRVTMPAVTDAQAIADAAEDYRESEHAGLFDLLAPTLSIPGLTPGTSRTVPPTLLRLAAECRNDAQGISPNQPAAGRWAIAQYATAANVVWDKDDLELLYDAGVNVVRVVDGALKVYGSRTAADPTTDVVALRVGSARLRMALREIARYYAEQDAFIEVDRGGTVLGNLEGVITGAINVYAKSLYYLEVNAELVEDTQQPGTFIVDVEVIFQAAPDAERLRVVISRQITEV